MKNQMKKMLMTSVGESQTMTSNHWKGKPYKKQENCDVEESKTIIRMKNENRPEKESQAQETEEDEVAMMCWENMDRRA